MTGGSPSGSVDVLLYDWSALRYIKVGDGSGLSTAAQFSFEMPPSVYSASHASTIIDDDRHNESSDPASFGEDVDPKLDPFLVGFEENDPANPMVCYLSHIVIIDSLFR